MKCLKCNYEWQPRKPFPKACPLCKQYIAAANKKEQK
jgi:rubrerythrin